MLLSLALFWYAAMRARENALAVVRRTCAELEAAWLDDTVSLTSLGLKRDHEGHWRVRRIYGFRYLDAGHQIHEGVVILLGDQLHTLLLDTGPDEPRPTRELI
ncbi:MAG: DUF3301 domain-containing protein [Magnetococcales bacterium]|nr:DUF3301 domain-containing protein [Magnetococcales bacterium]